VLRSSASRPGSWLLAFGIVCALVAVARDAAAFCRSRACDDDWPAHGLAWYPCVRDDDDCLVFGPVLHWPTNCLSLAVQKDGSANSAIDLETARAVIEDGFAAWAAADCGRGALPSFSLRDNGDVECRRAEYNERQPNANVFLFRDDAWPYDSTVDQLGLTTVTYNVETGEIVDADVEFNTFDKTFSTTDDELLVAIDFASIATHEIGHFLGLSHTREFGATMVAGYEGGVGMRSLEADDIAGVCALYPPDRELSSVCATRHGFSGTCGKPEKPEDPGCTLGPPNARSTLVPALVLATAMAVRRRRNRARRGLGA
jgi:hypothetical protein